MRLSKEEISKIKDIVSQYCQNSKIYLFGSRLDDSRVGGDIDIFIISKDSNYNTKLKIESKLELILGKPIDIIMHSDFSRKIEQEAMRGVEL